VPVRYRFISPLILLFYCEVCPSALRADIKTFGTNFAIEQEEPGWAK